MLLTNIKVPQEQVSFLQAVRQGLGAEQGLFFPTQWPKLDIDALLAMPFVARSSAILHALIGEELSAADVEAMVSQAFTFKAPLAGVAGVTPTGLQKPPDAVLGSQRTALKPSSSRSRLL